MTQFEVISLAGMYVHQTAKHYRNEAARLKEEGSRLAENYRKYADHWAAKQEELAEMYRQAYKEHFAAEAKKERAK